MPAKAPFRSGLRGRGPRLVAVLAVASACAFLEGHGPVFAGTPRPGGSERRPRRRRRSGRRPCREPLAEIEIDHSRLEAFDRLGVVGPDRSARITSGKFLARSAASSVRHIYEFDPCPQVRDLPAPFRRRGRGSRTRWSMGARPSEASVSMCAFSLRRARRPAWMAGWSVFTRPSRHSGKPVTLDTSVTAMPVFLEVLGRPPVERISQPTPPGRRPGPGCLPCGTRLINARFFMFYSSMIRAFSNRANQYGDGLDDRQMLLRVGCARRASQGCPREGPGSVRWSRMGPVSVPESTRCTVQPDSVSPAARTASCTFSPYMPEPRISEAGTDAGLSCGRRMRRREVPLKSKGNREHDGVRSEFPALTRNAVRKVAPAHRLGQGLVDLQHRGMNAAALARSSA